MIFNNKTQNYDYSKSEPETAPETLLNINRKKIKQENNQTTSKKISQNNRRKFSYDSRDIPNDDSILNKVFRNKEFTKWKTIPNERNNKHWNNNTRNQNQSRGANNFDSLGDSAKKISSDICNNVYPINIDIEYSFSPKLLIKSINTIIDNYEYVNQSNYFEGSNKSEKYKKSEFFYKTKKEATAMASESAFASPAIGRKNNFDENKEKRNHNNISKIFNSIFKNNSGYPKEFDLSHNKSDFGMDSFEKRNCYGFIPNYPSFSFTRNFNGKGMHLNKFQPPPRNRGIPDYFSPDFHHLSYDNYENICVNNFSFRKSDRAFDLNNRSVYQDDEYKLPHKFQKEKIFDIEKTLKFKTNLFKHENDTVRYKDCNNGDLMESNNLSNVFSINASFNNPSLNNIQQSSLSDVPQICTRSKYTIRNNIPEKIPSRLSEIEKRFQRNYALLKSNQFPFSNGIEESSVLNNWLSSYEVNNEQENVFDYKDSFHNNRDSYVHPYKNYQNISKSNSISKMKQRKIRFKYRMYSKEEKEFCLDLVMSKRYNINDVANCCQVPLKSLKRWLRVGCERKKGGGRKVKDPELESKLLIWYDEMLSKGMKPRYGTVRQKALKMTKSKNFMASKGWFEKFKKKYDLKFLSGRCNSDASDY